MLETSNKRQGNCALCDRLLSLTFHHLVPKKVHDKSYVKRELGESFDLHSYGIEVCTDCHKMIHRTISHKLLAIEFNTAEKLKKHPDMDKFIAWVRKQDKRVK